MSNCRQLYFACHRGEGVVGRLIRWATRGVYSHVSILLPRQPDSSYVTGDVTVYEAREGVGVRTGGLELHRAESVDLYSIPVSAEQYAAARHWLNRQVGKHYDWLAIAGFVLRRNQQRRRGEGIWFCSELAAALAMHLGCPIFRDTDPYLVSPVWFARSPVLLPVPAEEARRITPAVYQPLTDNG